MYPNPNTKGSPPLMKGTTGLGMTFKNGAIVAADKRISAGYMKASPNAKKIHMLTKNIALGIAGLVADAMALVDIMRAELKLYRLENNYEPTVKVAASLLTTILHNGYRSYQPWWTQLLVVGNDVQGQHVYSIDPSGAAIRENYAAIGSGTTFSLALLDNKYEEDISKDDAIKLAEEAIKGSIGRDLATGDGIDIYILEEGEEAEKKFIELKRG